ncbi:MAG: hypothetical protein FJ119_03115 [Deltaproteobacteria bacterium]|nr:hypothetical protein [Deltaproteobacteria bacterium]
MICLREICCARDVMVFFTAIVLASCVSAGRAVAADTTAVWMPESGAQAVFTAPDTGGAPCAETQRVGRSFYDFCSRWIGSKNGYSLKNIRIQTMDACRVKEYSQCADAYEIRITKAPGSSVYVGTLKYIEKVYRTPAGPTAPGTPESFQVAMEVPVTEFFMFIDGQWRY